MCLHGSPSVLSLSQLLPGIVGPEAQGESGGFTGVPQGGAIHAIYVEVCVWERGRHGGGRSVRLSDEESSKDHLFPAADITQAHMVKASRLRFQKTFLRAAAAQMLQ